MPMARLVAEAGSLEQAAMALLQFRQMGIHHHHLEVVPRARVIHQQPLVMRILLRGLATSIFRLFNLTRKILGRAFPRIQGHHSIIHHRGHLCPTTIRMDMPTGQTAVLREPTLLITPEQHLEVVP